MDTLWKKFTAMGTEIVVCAALAPEQAGSLDRIEAEIREFEKRFSRFIPGNELDSFNQASGQEVAISEPMHDILLAARQWQNYSQGTFDPTIIGNLERLGYDRSFTDIDQQVASREAKPDVGRLQADFAGRSRLDQLKLFDRRVLKPAGLRLDFGGFGKGYIVDQVSREVLGDAQDYWISAGGDLLASGVSDNGQGWKIGVQDPYQIDREIVSLDTHGAKLGIATSGVFKRRGSKGGSDWHHLIDPRTGLPVDNNILAVTAIADSATKADILAKTVLILGEQAGLEFVTAEPEAAALIFLKDGGIVFSNRVKKYL